MVFYLQLSDLTGELMRLAIGRISDGEVEYAQKICKFVRDIYRELTLVVPSMDENYDMKSKMETMLQSLTKIENGIIVISCLTLFSSSSERHHFISSCCFRSRTQQE